MSSRSSSSPAAAAATPLRRRPTDPSPPSAPADLSDQDLARATVAEAARVRTLRHQLGEAQARHQALQLEQRARRLRGSVEVRFVEAARRRLDPSTFAAVMEAARTP